MSTTFPMTAGSLANWTGYVTEYAGVLCTVNDVKPGDFTSEVKVELTWLVGPDLQREWITLLKESQVELHRPERQATQATETAIPVGAVAEVVSIFAAGRQYAPDRMKALQETWPALHEALSNLVDEVAGQ